MRSWARDWSAARNVLAVRLDGMGDLLMTEPALRAVKEAVPGRRLALLTSPAGAAAAALLPEVDEVIVYRSPWMKASGPRLDPARDRAMIDEIAKRGFDAGVIFTVYSQSPLPAALTLYLANVPRRLAYCRENPYGLLTHHLPESEPESGIRHEVERHLDLVANVGRPYRDSRIRADPGAAAVTRTQDLLRRHGLSERRDWLLVHVGASAESRRYPPEMYAEAIRSLAADHGLTPVFTGSGEERGLVREVMTGAGGLGVDLSGELGLGELTALIATAPVVLTNNTGPAHLAAATGTPVVVLYALTNPQHTPWRVASRVLSHEVPCRNCYRSVCPLGHHACLRGVAPQAVVGAVLELRAETAGAREAEADAVLT